MDTSTCFAATTFLFVCLFFVATTLRLWLLPPLAEGAAMLGLLKPRLLDCRRCVVATGGELAEIRDIDHLVVDLIRFGRESICPPPGGAGQQ